MMTNPKFVLFWVALALLAIHPYAVGAQQSDPMAKSIAAFSVAGITPFEAILKLGAQEQLPLGIICSDNELLMKQITISQSKTNTKSILAAILSGVDSYRAVVDK